MQQLKIITARAHEREAFWGGFKCTASFSGVKKHCKVCGKRSKLERKARKEVFVLSIRLHPQSWVLISYCFRPKQRQRSCRSKQMTIKLSNKHHPAMFPNADCGRARRESESGGSHIVSSHFDAELKTLGKKNKNQTSAMEDGARRRRREGEEKKRRERGDGAKHANTLHSMYTCLCFISGPADNLYWAWSGIKLMEQCRFEATTGSFPVCPVCHAAIKRFWRILRLESPSDIHWYVFDVVLLLLG